MKVRLIAIMSSVRSQFPPVFPTQLNGPAENRILSFPVSRSTSDHVGAQSVLFSKSADMRAPFAEKYPRITIGLVALAIFTITIAVEVQCLHFAGYFWR